MNYNSDYSSDDNSNSDTSQTQKAFTCQKHSQHSTLATSQLSIRLSKHCILDNQLFNAALDRTKTTPQQAMMIVTPALAAIGMDVK